jgi:hypothetical protein
MSMFPTHEDEIQNERLATALEKGRADEAEARLAMVSPKMPYDVSEIIQCMRSMGHEKWANALEDIGRANQLREDLLQTGRGRNALLTSHLDAAISIDRKRMEAEAQRDAALNAKVALREALKELDAFCEIGIEQGKSVKYVDHPSMGITLRALSDTPVPDYMAVVRLARIAREAPDYGYSYALSELWKALDNLDRLKGK